MSEPGDDNASRARVEFYVRSHDGTVRRLRPANDLSIPGWLPAYEQMPTAGGGDLRYSPWGEHDGMTVQRHVTFHREQAEASEARAYFQGKIDELLRKRRDDRDGI